MTKIIDVSLKSFLESNPSVDLGAIVVKCGAGAHLLQSVCESKREQWSNLFREHVINDGPFDSYRVAYVPLRSYVLYKKTDNEAQLWVCYTEPEHRKKGYMAELLLDLKNKGMDAAVDTKNLDLQRIAIRCGVSLY
ncbi:hypothetical protein [Vibrio sp. C8]